jgi:hypothetical protein
MLPRHACSRQLHDEHEPLQRRVEGEVRRRQRAQRLWRVGGWRRRLGNAGARQRSGAGGGGGSGVGSGVPGFKSAERKLAAGVAAAGGGGGGGGEVSPGSSRSGGGRRRQYGIGYGSVRRGGGEESQKDGGAGVDLADVAAVWPRRRMRQIPACRRIVGGLSR